MMVRIFACTILILAFSNVQAQVVDLDRSRLSTAAYYNYSEQGDVTIKMHVWGAVRYPGLYEIPRGTKLSELISLTGDPQLGPRTRRSTTEISLKLHRISDAQRLIIHQVEMKNEIVVQGEDPEVQSDDILSYEVVTQQGFRWRDVFPIVSMFGTIVIILQQFGNK